MEGASTSEQLIGAARSNNVALIDSILDGKNSKERADVINNTTDPIGNTLLHLAAHHGSLDVLYSLLDNDGVEIDPRNRLSENTPLHQAVEFATRPGNAIHGLQLVDLLIECGADVAIKNSSGKKAIDIAQQGKLTNIVNSLRGAQYAQEIAVADPISDQGSATSDEE